MEEDKREEIAKDVAGDILNHMRNTVNFEINDHHVLVKKRHQISPELLDCVNMLISKCDFEAKCANTKANLLKIFVIFTSFYDVISGMTIGMLSIFQPDSAIITVLGFILTALRALMMAFEMEKRSVLIKELGLKFNKTALDLRTMLTSDLTEDKLRKKIRKLNNLICEIEAAMFTNKKEARTRPSLHSSVSRVLYKTTDSLSDPDSLDSKV